MNLSKIQGLTVFLAALLPLPAPGQTQPPPPVPPATLIQQLGDDTYEVREAAAHQLQRLGRTAVDALRAGLKHSDREVRTRCEELLALAVRSDLEIELDAFVKGQRDPKAPPLPGWKRFNELAGKDLASRLLFSQLLREDKPLMEMLEKSPTKLAGQLNERLRQVQQKYAAVQGNGGNLPRVTSEINGLLLAASLANAIDLNNFYQVTNVFYVQPVRAEVMSNAASGRLVSRFLSARIGDFNMLSQAVYQANYLELSELVETKLKPAVIKHLEDAAKADDLNKLTQVAYLASNLHLGDLPDTKLKPILRKHAQAAAASGDLAKMQQIANAAQVLRMTDLIEVILKPAASQRILAAAEKLNDTNAFYQARYLAQILNMNEVFEAVMRPAAVRIISDAADHINDVNKFYMALNLAQNLNMPEALEGLLRPAGRKMVLTYLEQPGDWNKINQAVNLCRTLGIQDVLDDSVKPVFRKHAKELSAKTEDPNALNQLYNLAQNLQTPEVIEDHIKPALRKYFLSAKDKPINQNFVYQGLYMAKNLQMKEAVPFAIKFSGTKEVAGYARGVAIYYVGEFGTKEQVAQLEPLLTDKTAIGDAGINWTTVHCQVRDAVLAVVLTSKGQNLADYGFPYFQMIQGNGLFQTSANCAGFTNDTERDAAFKKYKDWQATPKK